MFPFFEIPFSGCSKEPWSDKVHKERKLQFLKFLRDGLETRLAALNAAIATIERQLSQEDSLS